MAEVALASAPDLVLPLRELTGLDLPDLHLSDLRMIPLPASIKIPPGLPLPPGVQLPDEIPLPRLGQPAPAGGRDTNDPFQATPGFIAAPGPEVTEPALPAETGEPGSVPAPVAPENLAAPADPNLAPAPVEAPAPAAEAPAAETPAAPAITADPRTPALSPMLPRELTSKLGAQVKELSRDTPFSMVAVTAPDLAGTTAMIRALRPDGGWGPWYQTEPVDTPGRGRSGTEPIYVGNTKSVQILMTRKNTAAPVDAVPAEGAPAEGAPEGVEPIPAAGVEPAPAVEAAPLRDHSGDPAQINLEKLAAILIDPGRGALDDNLYEAAAALPAGGPKVITRSQWGADEDLRCEEPTYDDGVNAITVHHTAGRNDYSKSESAGIVRSIYAYHAKTLGWCDIGYNALVDKYGQIFEGRFGGLDRPVEGAHAGGFNINTAGVAFMGNHESEAPSEAAMQSMGKFIGWRSKVAGIDPEGSTTMFSEGSDYTRYALGQAVKLPNVFAHRDVGNTTCPGDAAYDLMDRIRSIAEEAAGPVSPNPATTTTPRTPRNRPEQNAGNPQTPGQQSPEVDVATLAALTTKLLGMLDKSPVAKYWDEQGGPNSALGQPQSEPEPTMDGGQYAKFVNGYVYSTPNGQVFAIVGKILERFLQLGGATGILGLPASNEYKTPDGVRTDFQFGSLSFNKLTGIVTTVLKNWGAVQDPLPNNTKPLVLNGQNPAGTPIPDRLGAAPAQAAPIPEQLPELPAEQ